MLRTWHTKSYSDPYRPDLCRTESSLVHELTHLATPFIFATWFEEGTAYWVAQHLSQPG